MPASKSPTASVPAATAITTEAEHAGGQELSALVEAALQRERTRVAQVLHDTICQDLTGFHYLASALAARCQASSPEAAEKLLVLAEKIRTAGRTLGEFVHTLCPDGLP